VAELLGKDLQYELVDAHTSRPGHDLRYALDGSKLKEAGWRIPIKLEDAMKNIIYWENKHE
jgi:dTDP-D-glucose 4,6-dehydratase